MLSIHHPEHKFRLTDEVTAVLCQRQRNCSFILFVDEQGKLVLAPPEFEVYNKFECSPTGDPLGERLVVPIRQMFGLNHLSRYELYMNGKLIAQLGIGWRVAEFPIEMDGYKTPSYEKLRFASGLSITPTDISSAMLSIHHPEHRFRLTDEVTVVLCQWHRGCSYIVFIDEQGKLALAPPEFEIYNKFECSPNGDPLGERLVVPIRQMFGLSHLGRYELYMNGRLIAQLGFGWRVAEFPQAASSSA